MLETLFHELNTKHFQGSLPLPKLAWNTRLSTTAGRFSPRGWPKISSPRSEAIIEVAGYLRDIDEGEIHIRDTILHEMIHYWLWIRRRPYGHTKEFYSKMRETGAKRWNPVPKQRPPKYIYACRSCGVEIPARKKQPKDVACYECCKRHNRGYFHPKFRLYVKEEFARPHASDVANELQLGLMKEMETVNKPHHLPEDQWPEDQPKPRAGLGSRHRNSPKAPPPRPTKEEKITPFDEVVKRLQSLKEMVQGKKIRF